MAVRPLPTLVVQSIRLNGSLDRVEDDGTIDGWCWSPDEPGVQRQIAVLVDGVEVVRIAADQPRADLASAGVGSGRHAFRLVLPAERRRADATAVVALRDVSTEQAVGGPVTVRWRPATDPTPLTGSLDRISRDGWVSGWCWYPDWPDRHVELSVLIDEVAVGSVVADAFRPDLQQAGIGDGRHGFSFALPYTAIADRGTLTVGVQDLHTGQRLGEKITLRLGRMAAVEERIQDLEREIRLLRGQIETLQQKAALRDEDGASRELFATVAAFFQDLAQSGAAGRGVGAAALPAALAEMTARWAPLTLALPERPLATICIAATAPCETVHACIAAIHAARLDEQAEVVLLDDGAAGAETALLPTVVRNLRYVFHNEGSGLVAARNEIAAGAAAPLLVFLAPEARVSAGWLAEIAATFDAEPQAALLTGRLLRDDGLLQHAGLLATPAGRLADPGQLAPAEAGAFRFLRPIDAAAGYAFAVRREALRDLGGFSPLFGRFGHAVADLCARLREAGWAVLYQPLATAAWHDRGTEADGAPPDLALADEETLRLRERLHEGWPRPVGFVGRALVIDDDVPRPDHDAGSIVTFEQMLLLRRLGYHVTFAPVHGAEPCPHALDALARRGIALAAPPLVPSVTEFLKAEGERLDLVVIYRYANAELLAERVRTLAPRAKLVFAPADLHHLRERRRADVSGMPVPTAERAAELRCVRAADATIVNSDFEQALLRDEVDAARLVLLRWIARPVPPARGFAERRDICFVGNFRHPPNIDGVQWFVAEVLPRVRSRLPGLRLLLAGSDMPPAIGALACDAVEVLGWVRSLSDLFGAVRLSVAPLRFGAGFKGKVATSLAHGLPVVGSSISLEGTGLVSGDGMIVADDPEDFAREVVRLHEDAGLWAQQSARALERVAALYAPEAALDVWHGMLRRLDLPVAA